MATSSPTVIESPGSFQELLSSNTYVLADFHATWCGPCKAIAPTFNQLAAAETKKGHLAFAKIDVDANQDIAQKYGVRAMPTFILFKSGTNIQAIQGANPSALRSAVQKAAADKATPGAVFQSKGHVLGGEGAKAKTTSPSVGWDFSGLLGGGWVDTGVRFLGLYVVSLFAFEAYKAAEGSAWAKR